MYVGSRHSKVFFDKIISYFEKEKEKNFLSPKKIFFSPWRSSQEKEKFFTPRTIPTHLSLYPKIEHPSLNTYREIKSAFFQSKQPTLYTLLNTTPTVGWTNPPTTTTTQYWSQDLYINDFSTLLGCH